MYLRNIYSVHLHTVPGKGVEEVQKIFDYSTAYKKFRLTISHASFVENYIIDKLEAIESSKTYFTTKDLVKILRILRGRAYLSEEQSNDIVSFTLGKVPSHKEEPEEELEKETEEKKETKETKKIKESDAWEESIDLDYDMAAADDLSQKKVDADLERSRRYEEIRKMSDNI
jgi:hypothetical protein